jgi:hypothetical protein
MRVGWSFRVQDRLRRRVVGLWWADGGLGHLAVVQPPFLAVRAGRRQTRLNGIVSYQILVFRVVRSQIRRIPADLGFPPLINIAADLVPQLLVHNVDSALKDSVDWPVVGKTKWCRVVGQLAKV